MLRKFAAFRVPKEYYFLNPENRWRIVGKDMADLAQKVRLYRAQNEFPEIDFLESTIEHYLCGRPENIGACEGAGPLKRGIIPTFKAGIVILKNIMYNSFVNQEIADERAAICKDCPLNIFPDKHGFVKWADEMAGHAVGDRKSKFHNELGNCEGCTCLMRSKVFFPGPFSLSKEEKEKMKSNNPNCWQIKEK